MPALSPRAAAKLDAEAAEYAKTWAAELAAAAAVDEDGNLTLEVS